MAWWAGDLFIAGGSNCLHATGGSGHVPANGGDIAIVPVTHATVEVVQGAYVILVDPTVHAGYDGPYPNGVAPKISYEGLKSESVCAPYDLGFFCSASFSCARAPEQDALHALVVPVVTGVFVDRPGGLHSSEPMRSMAWSTSPDRPL